MDISNRLQFFMRLNHMAPCDLARKSNVSNAEIHKVLTRKIAKPRYSTMEALAEALGVDVDLLYGLPESDSKDYEDIFRSRKDREYLLKIYSNLNRDRKLTLIKDAEILWSEM